ncbi:outer membrane beta-barrel protein [Pseudomonas sp. PDNC002]|uniref:outer membrane beta-barrel protein n=1 Tax=Pseudomonas sp. PDNC002 TaxID=2811422 RepID=UPI001964898B|nr:outer membrane beta-barrel protein [Pseudomonas sp. PDNC002]QRY78143.1 outer membrane beta-barrel protein [Pseudomonas sp. PDNC002]
MSIEKCSLAGALLATTALSCAHAEVPDKGEGTLARQLFGPALEEDYGITVSGLLDIGYIRNNRSTSEERKDGLSNSPLPGFSDEGAELGSLHVFVDKPLASNFIPRVTPLPGIKPEAFSFGFSMEALYGRNGQFARTYGWDMHWPANSPGDDDPASAKRHKQLFLAMPNLFASAYLPYGTGLSLLAGIFGPAIGYEIPPNIRESRNRFASKTYAFLSEPGTLAGVLGSTRLLDSEAGIIGLELGLVQGWNNLRDNNHDKSVTGALRWRSPDMGTWVDYEFIVGNEQNSNADDVQLFASRVISPHAQFKQQHSLNGWHAFDAQWSLGAEFVYGQQAGDGKPETINALNGKTFDGAQWWGINSVVTYQQRKDLSYSLRGEYFRDRDGYILPGGQRGDLNALTVGLRYDVNANLSIRPELRYDWFDPLEHDAPFGNGRDRTQLTGLIEALVYF